LSWEEEFTSKRVHHKAVSSSPQKETEGTASLPQEGSWKFVHEMISEEGVELLKRAGINDELVFETGDWVADHDLGIYLVLYRFGGRTNWKKTYKLILQGQVIEFKTKTIFHQQDFSYEDGEFIKGVIVKNVSNMLLPLAFEGQQQRVLHIIQAALSAASPSYDTVIYRANFDLV
jgi:hypothetical protein